MAMNAKVSVLITSYNFREYIQAAVESVLSQSYQGLEIIISDDGSTDETDQVIRSLAQQHSNIIPVLSDHNQGISQNMNKGLDRCTGKYVALLSGDDLMASDKIRKQIRFLEQNEDCGLCTHEMEAFDSRTNEVLYQTSQRFRMPAKGRLDIVFPTHWTFDRETKNIPSSMMLRQDFLGKYRYDLRLRFRGEWLHIIDCLANSNLKWGHIPEVLGRYRVHDKQIHISKEADEASFEEAMLVLAIADARYPKLSKLIKNKHDFIHFQHLVFDWHKPEKRKAYENQFWREAGIIKWCYLKLARFILAHQKLMALTRPFRKAVKSTHDE